MWVAGTDMLSVHDTGNLERHSGLHLSDGSLEALPLSGTGRVVALRNEGKKRKKGEMMSSSVPPLFLVRTDHGLVGNGRDLEGSESSSHDGRNKLMGLGWGKGVVVEV